MSDNLHTRKKGKNFSANNLGQRRASDLYQTHYSMVVQLLDRVAGHLPRSILEPAQGGGAIVRVLEAHGYEVTAYDREVNFLTDTRPFHTIITNPPFSMALDFILQAKRISTQFFFLLPLAYLHGKERLDRIYVDTTFPLREVMVFARYPMLGAVLREDGKYPTGMMVYAWYWFDKAHVGPASISWIDNQPFILGKADLKSESDE